MAGPACATPCETSPYLRARAGNKSPTSISNLDKDPKNNPDAKPLSHISWSEFRKMVGDEWIPGMNAPFDPIAAQKAEELGIKVVVLNGKNLDNLRIFKNNQNYDRSDAVHS